MLCHRPAPNSLRWAVVRCGRRHQCYRGRETHLVKVVAGTVFAVRPPPEVPGQLTKDPLEELEIARSAQCLFHAVKKDRGPGVHRWIDVAEVPLISRDLAGWVLVSPSEQEVQLLLGKIDVDGGERDRVKGKVPSGKPWIFPLVRHRDHMLADHVEPLAVPRYAGFASSGSARCSSSHLSTS